MKVVALVSGGKDSCYAMMKCIQYGHEIVALANLLPADDAQDELDSYMYQTVGHQIVVSYATCMGVPLFRRRIKGSTRNHDLSYNLTPGDEVEDMFILLNEVKRQIPAVTAVSSGAIASDYQRLRVESVCSRLGLVSLAYLWKQDQSLLLREMIRSGIVAIIVKVAAIGLDPSKHLGKEIAYLETHLHKLKELYGINVCGEGGEYETLTLDCPLFKNARIVLDEFQVILHSSDSIAPVGILHPLSFHLEKKMDSVSSSDSNGGTSVYLGDISTVYEVLENHQQNCEAMSELIDVTTEKYDAMKENLKFSKSRKDDIYSISCWLQHSETSTSLQVDLEVVLMGIETQLAEHGCSWENVLYIHLYIADMNEFSTANETYVRFITQEKCRFGVPSRSTIELPLLQVGLGRAYMEILVAQDHSKKVLHVQSISCWAPSCIGPYSQATLHKDILYMAGQLGLDPPTMLLCNGGPTAELQQALENSEAIARSFNCSISTSAILFIVYCSACIERSNRTVIENEMTRVLGEMKLGQLDTARISEVLDPIFLYVLVPDLPKRALVEVKPMLCLAEHAQAPPREVMHDPSVMQGYWGFQYETWHDKCLQKCSIEGQVCAAILSVTEELAQNICSKSIPTVSGDGDLNVLVKEDQLKRIAQFCIYRLDKILLENNLSWDDVLNFRIYFATRLNISHGTISQIFANVFSEFAQIRQRVKITTEPIFNLVPVVGTGKSASSMDDIITCELISRKL